MGVMNIHAAAQLQPMPETAALSAPSSGCVRHEYSWCMRQTSDRR